MSSKKHGAIDDILSDFDEETGKDAPRAGTRFLKRSTAIGERMSGEREEKVLRWVDPAECRMWERHNRDYELLTEENCRDLIEGIRAQGRQEFPAIVRRVADGEQAYEVICGARRHFAISWLQAHNYPQFKYLVEVRDLTDEEAFRLSDIENRDREDISDYERARDYAQALDLYYGGRQNAMAKRLEVSEAWLSRYLVLARLPDEVVRAFPSLREIRELHARTLKPLLSDPAQGPAVLDEARALAAEQAAARSDGREVPSSATVMTRLKAAGRAPAAPPAPPQSFGAVTARRKGRKFVLEVPAGATRAETEAALMDFLKAHYGPR